MKRGSIYLIILFALGACSEGPKTDAYGSFEATETIVSAEANGKIMQFNLQEGTEVKAGDVIGYIDSTQLHLTKLQLLQNQKALLSRRPDARVQIESLQRELDNAITDQQRIEKLVKGEVASQKQLDDANTRVSIIRSKIDALQSSLSISTNSINEDARTIGIQLAQVNDQLRKCRIVNPVNGTVLSTFVNPFEMAVAGKPLYKVADLSQIYLKAYITSDQFAQVKTGQAVNISVDAEGGAMKSFPGTITWINPKAEFTPKTIQTKNERANLVYAIKVGVKNDGMLKIGMYGEIKF